MPGVPLCIIDSQRQRGVRTTVFLGKLHVHSNNRTKFWRFWFGILSFFTVFWFDNRYYLAELETCWVRIQIFDTSNPLCGFHSMTKQEMNYKFREVARYMPCRHLYLCFFEWMQLKTQCLLKYGVNFQQTWMTSKNISSMKIENMVNCMPKRPNQTK